MAALQPPAERFHGEELGLIIKPTLGGPGVPSRFRHLGPLASDALVARRTSSRSAIPVWYECVLDDQS
jgi:hypothetical protein